jgi:hypothetical protein
LVFQSSELILNMGVLRYENTRATLRGPGRPAGGSIATLLALGLLCLATPIWAADEGADEKPVSTSPMTTHSSKGDAHRARSRARTPTPPLTRAAARRQVETISPVDWLARYGHVDIERRR